MLPASPYAKALAVESDPIPLSESPAVEETPASATVSQGSSASVPSAITSTHPAKPTAPPLLRHNQFGWPVPSALSDNPEEARAAIPLPDFDPLLLEKARVISNRFPLAEAQYRHLWAKEARAEHLEIPHFERVFAIASVMASVPHAQQSLDYDALVILTAWHSVRPGIEGFLGSYPKALLCPLSHGASPAALGTLSGREQSIFERRAPGLPPLSALQQICAAHLCRLGKCRFAEPAFAARGSGSSDPAPSPRPHFQALLRVKIPGAAVEIDAPPGTDR